MISILRGSGSVHDGEWLLEIVRCELMSSEIDWDEFVPCSCIVSSDLTLLLMLKSFEEEQPGESAVGICSIVGNDRPELSDVRKETI